MREKVVNNNPLARLLLSALLMSSSVVTSLEADDKYNLSQSSILST